MLVILGSLSHEHKWTDKRQQGASCPFPTYFSWHPLLSSASTPRHTIRSVCHSMAPSNTQRPLAYFSQLECKLIFICDFTIHWTQIKISVSSSSAVASLSSSLLRSSCCLRNSMNHRADEPRNGRTVSGMGLVANEGATGNRDQSQIDGARWRIRVWRTANPPFFQPQVLGSSTHRPLTAKANFALFTNWNNVVKWIVFSSSSVSSVYYSTAATTATTIIVTTV